MKKAEEQFTYLSENLKFVDKRKMMIWIAALLIYKMETGDLFVLNWAPGQGKTFIYILVALYFSRVHQNSV